MDVKLDNELLEEYKCNLDSSEYNKYASYLNERVRIYFDQSQLLENTFHYLYGRTITLILEFIKNGYKDNINISYSGLEIDHGLVIKKEPSWKIESEMGSFDIFTEKELSVLYQLILKEYQNALNIIQNHNYNIEKSKEEYKNKKRLEFGLDKI